MQGLKDTFYQVLRDRVAAGNGARTVVIRGVTRPGVVTAENELPGAAVDGIAPVEAFCLRWTGLRAETQGPATLWAALCEIRYATDGSSGGGGLDRGRALGTVDAELVAAVASAPMTASALVAQENAGGGASTETPTGTRIWWGDVTFKPASMRGERMERVAEVEVFGYV